MNRAEKRFAGKPGPMRFAILALLAVLTLAGCGTTEPGAPADVSAYAWPTTPNASMKYKRVVYSFNGDSTESESSYIVNTSSFGGRTMYRLYDTVRSSSTSYLFLPTRDTLYVEFDPSGSRYALVGPLVRNHTWSAAYFDNEETVPKVKATVLEHYAVKRVEGVTYEDVVAVEYKSLDPEEPNKWIRLYAKGIGEVQTITLTYPKKSSGGTVTGDALLSERTILVRTDAANY